MIRDEKKEKENWFPINVTFGTQEREVRVRVCVLLVGKSYLIPSSFRKAVDRMHLESAQGILLVG